MPSSFNYAWPKFLIFDFFLKIQGLSAPTSAFHFYVFGREEHFIRIINTLNSDSAPSMLLGGPIRPGEASTLFLRNSTDRELTQEFF